ARGEIVGPLEGCALGERRVLTHPFFAVSTFALDEEAGQGAALRLGGAGQVAGLEIWVQQPEQGMELRRLAPSRRAGQQAELLPGLPGDGTDEVVALLLAGGSSGRAGAGVGFVYDHQFWALLNEHLTAGVSFDEVDADDLVGVVIVHAGIALDLAVA